MKLNQLEREFVSDHQNATHALKSLILAVSAGDAVLSRQQAKELDAVAGPHIAFEEACLYPLVAQSRGKKYEAQLRSEHHEVVNAVAEIRNADWSTVSPEQKQQWLQHLQVGMDHIVTCGTLLSHLTGLDDDTHRKLLDKLQQFKNDKVLWTELPKQS